MELPKLTRIHLPNFSVRVFNSSQLTVIDHNVIPLVVL